MKQLDEASSLSTSSSRRAKALAFVLFTFFIFVVVASSTTLSTTKSRSHEGFVLTGKNQETTTTPPRIPPPFSSSSDQLGTVLEDADDILRRIRSQPASPTPATRTNESATKNSSEPNRNAANTSRTKKLKFPKFPISIIKAAFAMSGIKSLAINYSDSFFTSNSTCNQKIGGQLYPPALCTREFPCVNLNPSYAAKSVHVIETPQFFDDDDAIPFHDDDGNGDDDDRAKLVVPADVKKRKQYTKSTKTKNSLCRGWSCSANANDSSGGAASEEFGGREQQQQQRKRDEQYCSTEEKFQFEYAKLVVAKKVEAVAAAAKQWRMRQKRKQNANDNATLVENGVDDAKEVEQERHRLFLQQQQQRILQNALPKWKYFDDGPLRQIYVPNTYFPPTSTRRFCQYLPSPATSSSLSSSSSPASPNATTTSTIEVTNSTNAPEKKVPLVIMIPSSGTNASSFMYEGTTLRDLAERRGFALMSIQPMNRHWHASGWVGPRESGAKNDDVFRNFTHNDDIKFLDALIDRAVGSGRIDAKRVYIFGASNGLMFGSFYAILRSGSRDAGALLNGAESEAERAALQGLYTGRTPNGNRVAAVAGFSGSDPFKGVGWSKQCQTSPAPKSRLPVYIISRLCDVVPCKWVREWLARLATEIGSIEVRWTLLDKQDRTRPTSFCSRENRKKMCNANEDVFGHAFYPDHLLPDVVDFLFKFTADDLEVK